MTASRSFLAASLRHGAACGLLQAQAPIAAAAVCSASGPVPAAPSAACAQQADASPLSRLGQLIRGIHTSRAGYGSVTAVHIPGTCRGFSSLPVEDNSTTAPSESPLPDPTDVTSSDASLGEPGDFPDVPEGLPRRNSLTSLRKALVGLTKNQKPREAIALYEAWRSQDDAALATYGPFIPDVGAAGNYVHAVYSATRNQGAVRGAIDRVEQDGVPPCPQLYNTLMKSAMNSPLNRKPKAMAYKLQEILQEMEGKGSKANFVTRAILARANISAGHFQWARSELKQMRELAGGSNGVVVGTKAAILNLQQHADLGGRLVASRFQNYATSQGYEVLRELLDEEILPSPSIMISILEVLPDRASIFDRELTLKFMDHMLSLFTAPEVTHLEVLPTEGCLLALLVRAACTGDMELAKPAWIINRRVCSATGRVPCVAAYQSVIQCRMRAGDLKGVLKMVSELERDHPDDLEARTPIPSLRSISDAYGESAQQVDAMYFELENMQKEGTTVTTAMMNCVIGACVRLRDLSRMFETYESYATLGIAPDTNTFNMLLLGAYGNQQLQTVPALLEEMQSLKIPVNRQTYEILINVKLKDQDQAGAMGLLQEMHNAGYPPSASALHRVSARGPWHEAGEKLLGELFAAYGNEYSPKSGRNQEQPEEIDEEP